MSEVDIVKRIRLSVIVGKARRETLGEDEAGRLGAGSCQARRRDRSRSRGRAGGGYPATGADWLGVGALTLAALGVVAVGVLAIGRWRVGSLGLREGRIRKLRIDELEIGNLLVRNQKLQPRPETSEARLLPGTATTDPSDG